MHDFEQMTIDEIEAVKAELIQGINDARDEMKRAEDVLKPRRMLALAEQALANAGVSGVTIAPEPAVLAATPGETATEGVN